MSRIYECFFVFAMYVVYIVLGDENTLISA
jgi:hypothetical protein